MDMSSMLAVVTIAALLVRFAAPPWRFRGWAAAATLLVVTLLAAAIWSDAALVVGLAVSALAILAFNAGLLLGLLSLRLLREGHSQAVSGLRAAPGRCPYRLEPRHGRARTEPLRHPCVPPWSAPGSLRPRRAAGQGPRPTRRPRAVAVRAPRSPPACRCGRPVRTCPTWKRGAPDLHQVAQATR